MYRKYRGRLRVGTRGFSGLSFPGQDYITKARNVVYDDGILQMIAGITKYDSSGQVSGAPVGYGALVWEPDETASNILSAWANGKVYLEDSGNVDATEIKDWGTALQGPVSIFTAGEEASGEAKKLFCLTPEQEPFYLDGTGQDPLSLNGNSDWSGTNQPSAGTLHDSRVVLWGNKNFPHNLYFSLVNDHTKFAGPGSFISEITPGAGKEIRACVSYIKNRLYVFKDRGIFHIDTTDIATASYLPVTTYSLELGIAGSKAWEFVDGDLWFLDQNGMLRSMVAVDSSNDLRTSNLFLQLNMQSWVKQNVNRRRLKFAEMHYDREEGLLYVSVPGKTSSTNNIRIIIDLKDKGNPKVSFDQERGDFFSAGFFKEEPEGIPILHYAGGNGYVYRTGSPNKTADGEAYTAVFRTSQEDFRYLEPILQQPMADTIKRFDSLLISVIGSDNTTISVQPYVDGIAYGSGFTISVAGNSQNTILTTNSQFDLTDSLLTSDVEDSSRVDHRERIGARGRYIAFEFSSQSNFKIIEAYVNFAVQGITGVK